MKADCSCDEDFSFDEGQTVAVMKADCSCDEDCGCDKGQTVPVMKTVAVMKDRL